MDKLAMKSAFLLCKDCKNHSKEGS